jgi:hypothetical protein
LCITKASTPPVKAVPSWRMPIAVKNTEGKIEIETNKKVTPNKNPAFVKELTPSVNKKLLFFCNFEYLNIKTSSALPNQIKGIK